MARTLHCDIELAWAAGFFDGEGCIRNNTSSSGTRKYKHLQIQITQNNREPLDRFQKAIGGYGKIYQHRAGYFMYSLARLEQVDEILEKLWPYLCSPKRDQANRAIESIGRVA